MAFNDAGAYWLSKTSDIKNPYFGKKMLICGEVKDSLDFRHK
jgi:Cu(I)/Ag(I) efflux system membrane fusion protein